MGGYFSCWDQSTIPTSASYSLQHALWTSVNIVTGIQTMMLMMTGGNSKVGPCHFLLITCISNASHDKKGSKVVYRQRKTKSVVWSQHSLIKQYFIIHKTENEIRESKGHDRPEKDAFLNHKYYNVFAVCAYWMMMLRILIPGTHIQPTAWPVAGCHSACCTDLHPRFFNTLHPHPEFFLWRVRLIALTLSGLSLGDPLSDYPAGVVDGCGRLELHRLHDVALADADLQRQHHHLGGQCGRGGPQLHLQENTDRAREGEFIARHESRRP